MTAAFAAGQRVQILATPTVGHSRVPSYARGRVGVVERVLSDYVIPEDEAWMRLDGRREVLYRVRIPQRQLWPDYQPRTDDALELEIFEHWLQEAPDDRR
jgi:nitrile hydratase